MSLTEGGSIAPVSHKSGFNVTKYMSKIKNAITSMIPRGKTHHIAPAPSTTTAPAKGIEVSRRDPLGNIPQTTISTTPSKAAGRNPGKEVLSAASREAWGPQDPGPNTHATYMLTGQLPSQNQKASGTNSVVSKSLITSSVSPTQSGNTRTILSLPNAIEESPITHPFNTTNEEPATSDSFVFSKTLIAKYHLSPGMASSESYNSRALRELAQARTSHVTDATGTKEVPIDERVKAYNQAIISAEHAVALGYVAAANQLLVMYREGVKQEEGGTQYLIQPNTSKSTFWFNVTQKLQPSTDHSMVLRDKEYQQHSTNKLTDPVTKMVRFLEISRVIHPPIASFPEKEISDWHQWFDSLQHEGPNTPLSQRADIPYGVFKALTTYRDIQRNTYA